MRLVLKLLIFTLALGSLQSCVSKKKYDELLAAKEATDQALAETQAQVKALQDENADLQSTLESEKERLNGEISAIRADLDATKSQMAQVSEKLNMTEAELNKLKAEIDGIFSAYADSGLKLEERDGRLYVVTSEKISYRSSSSRLTNAERDALSALAEKLKSSPNVKILVEGHTDNKQFVADSGRDNWDLSVARAMSVVRQLIKNGVSPSQVAAVGRGEYEPAASNDSDEGRAQNRRSVITPEVKLGGMIKN